MSRWNPNLFRRKGRDAGYDEQYLTALDTVGRKLLANRLPVVFTLANLAHECNVLYADLHAVVGRKKLSDGRPPYRNFSINKRSGGKRWISVPAPPLFSCQQWINENILRECLPHHAACAYTPGRRLRNEVGKHCGADWLLKIDLKDFFGNISERQIYRIFRDFGYPNLLSFEMARLCTKASRRRRGPRWTNITIDRNIQSYPAYAVGSLPQGAPTSPMLSNLAAIPLDEGLQQIADEHGAIYSRYADDLCFSFTRSSRNNVVSFKKSISEILHQNYFQINERKTQICPPGSRKIFVGLVLNEDSPKIPREYRDLIRMHLHFCAKHGIAKHCEIRGFRSVVGFRDHLYGLISYVNTVEPKLATKFLEEFNALPWVRFDI